MVKRQVLMATLSVIRVLNIPLLRKKNPHSMRIRRLSIKELAKKLIYC